MIFVSPPPPGGIPRHRDDPLRAETTGRDHRAQANGAIAEETGRTAVHPLQVIARAYGIPEEV